MLCSCVLLLASLPNLVAAQQATIRIDTLYDQAVGQNVEIPIYLESITPGAELRSLRLLFGIDGVDFKYFRFSQEFYDCIWNSIGSWDFPNTECSNGFCPPALVTIKIFNFSGGSCSVETPIEIGRFVAEVQGEVGQFYPFRFFWVDCVENAVGFDAFGLDTVHVSDRVFDFDGIEITADQPLPSHFGAPSSCLTGGPDTTRIRGIDFINGGIGISYVDTTHLPRAAFEIEKTHLTLFGIEEQVSVNCVTPFGETGEPLTIGSFDFLLQYDTGAATFLSAAPGQMCQDSAWDYFVYQGNLDLGLIRIMGVADTTGSGESEYMSLVDEVAEFAVLTLQTTNHDSTYECVYSPIRWIWYNCNNNAITSDVAGDSLFLSNRIYSFDWYGGSIHQDVPFPTTYGAPTSCIVNQPPGYVTTRAIDFVHGGMDFICADSIDARGDINLNGVAHEIADWVLFTNYFFYGLSVFTVNLDEQVLATDVNADGETLTFDDLMYLYRVIIGDALPYPTPPAVSQPDTVVLSQDTVAKTITVEAADGVSALLLYFEGEISTSSTFPNHDLGYRFDSSLTRIMIFPSFGNSPEDALIATGELLVYEGDGRLTGALASFRGTSAIEVIVEGGPPSQCCTVRGNVDGATGPGGPIDVSDLTRLVTYLFGSGAVLPCPEEANVDGITGAGGPIDVVDLTYLVAYLFGQGPPPPPCN